MMLLAETFETFFFTRFFFRFWFFGSDKKFRFGRTLSIGRFSPVKRTVSSSSASTLGSIGGRAVQGLSYEQDRNHHCSYR